MDSKRLVVLLLAAGAAGVVALMVRNVMGGGAKPVEESRAAAPTEVSEVLVASQRIDAGKFVSAGQVRWQPWPAKIIDPAFIRKSGGQTLASIVEGSVSRAPMVEGEPITYAKIVKSQGAGFMAATLTPGMRAVSINASMGSIVGGFVLPNNRVDVVSTNTTEYPKRGASKIIVSNARVLAVDQSSDSAMVKAVSEVKTVTLEMTAEQARTVAMAQASGTITLALRSLGDDEAAAAANTPSKNDGSARRKALTDSKASSSPDGDDAQPESVTVIRYGRVRRTVNGGAQ